MLARDRSAGTSTSCADLLKKISVGLSRSGDPFYDTVQETKNILDRKEIFWISDLANLELLVLQTRERRRERYDSSIEPLDDLRTEIDKARAKNFEDYEAKWMAGNPDEKKNALNSFFYMASSSEFADRALKYIHEALVSDDIELNRWAFKGLWSLWVLYDAASEKDESEGRWIEFRAAVEDLLPLALEVRLKVLKADLEAGKFLPDEASDRMLAMLQSKNGILTQREAEALFSGIIELSGMAPEGHSLTRSTLEADWKMGNFQDDSVILAMTDPVKPFFIPQFAIELIQLLRSGDAIVNENARLYATYLMEYARHDDHPWSVELIRSMAERIRREQNEEKNIQAAETQQLEVMKEKERLQLPLLVSHATTPTGEQAAIAAIRLYLSSHGTSFSDLRFPDSKHPENTQGLRLDQIADLLRLSDFANLLRGEFVLPH